MGPSFLCIGSPRSGTTWLHHALGLHPRVVNLPVKELRQFGDNPWSREGKARRVEQSRSRRNAPDWWDDWLARWSAAGGSDEEYLALFRGVPGVVGDISPSYCASDRYTAATVREVVGDVPALLLMRDPVERDWSQAKVTLQKQRGQPLTYETCAAFFASDFCARRSDYPRILAEWGAAFALTPVFFDDIQRDKPMVLRRVCAALGLPPDRIPLPKVEATPSRAPEGEMGEALRGLLREMHRDRIHALAGDLGGWARRWRDRHYA